MVVCGRVMYRDMRYNNHSAHLQLDNFSTPVYSYCTPLMAAYSILDWGGGHSKKRRYTGGWGGGGGGGGEDAGTGLAFLLHV